MSIRNLSIIDMVQEYVPYTFIVYQPSSNCYWWQKLLDKHYGHCYIVHWDGLQWYRVEQVWDRLAITPIWVLESYSVGLMNIEAYYKGKGYTTQPVDLSWFKTEGLRNPIGFEFNNCVTTVKSFLGIWKPFIVTPKQLFKYIERYKYGIA